MYCRQRIEEHVSRIEKKYEKLKFSQNQALPQPVFQVDAELLALKASEEAIKRLEERQQEMSRNQFSTESKINLLENELRNERNRCKILQDRTALLQATSDANYSLAKASALSLQSNEEKKRPKKKITTGKQKYLKSSKKANPGPTQKNAVGKDHFRMELKDIPFVVGTSTSPSYSVGANYQQILSMLKKHNTALCSSNDTHEKKNEISLKSGKSSNNLAKQSTKNSNTSQ